MENLTLDELLQANVDMLKRMKAEDWEKRDFVQEYKTQIYAHRWWNFNENPPIDYFPLVYHYIRTHPKEFKGASPQ